MKDTSDKMNTQFINMIMKRSGEERLLMGCSMYTTAKRIVKSSILAKNPDISDKEMKKKILTNFMA